MPIARAEAQAEFRRLQDTVDALGRDGTPVMRERLNNLTTRLRELRADLDENRKETKDLEEARKSQSSSQQNLIDHLTSQVAKMKLKSEQGEKGLRKMVMVGKKELKECRLELKAAEEKGLGTVINMS